MPVFQKTKSKVPWCRKLGCQAYRDPSIQLKRIIMNQYIYRIAFISFFLFSLSAVFAQTTQDTLMREDRVVVKMKNGDEYVGQIVKRDSALMVIRTENGDFDLISSKVSSIEVFDYKGKFQFPNPHDSRYFFGPSGIPVKKGKGYYQNVLVTFNFVNYGVTKNISLGGGFEFISTILGHPIWFLTPKVGFDISDNFHAGGGFIMAGFAGEGTATLGYGVATIGHAESNLSVGAGYGLMDGEFSDYPAIMISGTHRVGNGIALLSENYLFPNGSGTAVYFGIHGIRLMARKNSFDIGAIVIPEIAEDVPALPYVSYVRVF